MYEESCFYRKYRYRVSIKIIPIVLDILSTQFFHLQHITKSIIDIIDFLYVNAQ
jgi:hypothetical protein